MRISFLVLAVVLTACGSAPEAPAPTPRATDADAGAVDPLPAADAGPAPAASEAPSTPSGADAGAPVCSVTPSTDPVGADCCVLWEDLDAVPNCGVRHDFACPTTGGRHKPAGADCVFTRSSSAENFYSCSPSCTRYQGDDVWCASHGAGSTAYACSPDAPAVPGCTVLVEGDAPGCPGTEIRCCP